jgi:hypothetical protein
MAKLPEVKVKRLSGTEPFHCGGDPLSLSVLNFWQWASSNIAANNLRGHLAEFLVASDLGLAGETRSEWDTCDIWTPKDFRIEVKSASYIQQWQQSQHSKISFGIAPTRGWDYEKQQRTQKAQRNSDAYVFCLITTKKQKRFDPTDLKQWAFYVVATAELDAQVGAQKTLSLSALKSLRHLKCRYGEMHSAVCKVLRVNEL